MRGRMFGAMALGLMIVACGNAGDTTRRTQQTMNGEIDRNDAGGATDMAALGRSVARRAGIELPASATIEFADAVAGHDDAARLIFTVSAADWEKLKAAPPIGLIDPATFVASQAFHLGRDEGVWNPRSVAGLIAGQTFLKDQAEALNVGVAPEQAGVVRVYIFWHQL